MRKSFGGFSSEKGARTAVTILSFVETCKLMKKNVLDFFKGFFDMVVGGRTDYEQMTQALLCVNEKIKNEFIQLYGNLSTPVNAGAGEYCHRGWMLTIVVYLPLNSYRRVLTC